ncbi:hypothetical protein [Catenuloplanes japonicus]|nr:hypothetical protein [Catenuloplanes japonicus]
MTIGDNEMHAYVRADDGNLWVERFDVSQFSGSYSPDWINLLTP